MVQLARPDPPRPPLTTREEAHYLWFELYLRRRRAADPGLTRDEALAWLEGQAAEAWAHCFPSHDPRAPAALASALALVLAAVDAVFGPAAPGAEGGGDDHP